MNSTIKVTTFTLILATGLTQGLWAAEGAARNKGKAKAETGLPDKPVTPEQLGAADYKRFKAPLEVTIKPVAVTDDIPPMSFTTGTSRNHLNLLGYHSGFEPMAFRPLIRADADHPDKVLMSPRDYIGLGEGFFDGARVRVYHPIDGRLVKIRDCVLPKGGHKSSGWYRNKGALACKADRTSYSLVTDETFTKGRKYWFAVAAVDAFGRQSEPSNPVSVVAEAIIGKKEAAKLKVDAPIQKFKFKEGSDNSAIPATPGNLKLTVGDDHVIRLSWSKSNSPDVVGYRILTSPTDPATHQGYSLDLPNRSPRPDQIIQQNDLVFVDQIKYGIYPEDASGYVLWPSQKIDFPLKRGTTEGKTTGDWWSDGSDFPVKWSFKKHSDKLPQGFDNPGETYLSWENLNNDVTGFEIYRHGGTPQGFYPVLDATDYTIEAWVKGSANVQVVFLGTHATLNAKLPYGQKNNERNMLAEIPAIDIPLTDEWQHFSYTFRNPKLNDGNGLGQIYLSIDGTGEFCLDNLLFYESKMAPAEYPPITRECINVSNMRFARTHEMIKTKWGYTLDGMTSIAGRNNYHGSGGMKQFTVYTLLDQIKKTGNVNPWLQIEMCLSEEEWLGFAEWICSPYDPAKDTPQSKPWAYKRYAMGQQKPWMDEWEHFGLEISNETWNRSFAPYDMGWGMTIRDGKTGEQHSWGACYGMLNEYILNTIRQSPYWTEQHEKKLKSFLCGWTPAQTYGAEAKRYSPSADVITYAGYQHNDQGTGDPRVITDFKRFYWLQWGQSAIAQQTAKSVETEKILATEGIAVESGVYEFGPAYHVMPNDPIEAKEVDAYLGRGLGAAVFCMDAVLIRGQNNFTDQAFFTFGHQSGTWGSHARIVDGAHPYPVWKAFTLYNQHGTGQFLELTTQNAPRWDFPAYTTEDNMHKVKRDALPDCPLISTYATTKGDRLTLFVLSRKLDNFSVAGDDGYTPATFKLPIRKAKKITLYKLAGDPRIEDRYRENIKVEEVAISNARFDGSLTINETTGGDARGLPPSSVFMYVFEGTDIGDVNDKPAAGFVMPTGVQAGQSATFQNTSTDLDNEPLDCLWQFGSQKESKDLSPSIVFDKPGLYDVKLTVSDRQGEQDSAASTVQVGVELDGVLFQPMKQASMNGAKQLTADWDGNTLSLTSDGDVNGNTFGAFIGESQYRRDFTFTATVDSLDGNGAAEPLGGIVLMTPNKSGLGFSHDRLLQYSVLASLLVSPDGTVFRKSDGGGRNAKHTKLTSASLPIKLSIEVKSGTATLRVNGQVVDTVANLQQYGLSPSIVASTGGGRGKVPAVTLKASNIALDQSN